MPHPPNNWGHEFKKFIDAVLQDIQDVRRTVLLELYKIKTGEDIGFPYKLVKISEHNDRRVYYIAVEKNGVVYAARVTVLYEARRGDGILVDVEPVFVKQYAFRHGEDVVYVFDGQLYVYGADAAIKTHFGAASSWAVSTAAIMLDEVSVPVVGMWSDGWRDFFNLHGELKCDEMGGQPAGLVEISRLPSPHKALALAIAAKFISPAVASANDTYIDRMVLAGGEGGEGKTMTARYVMSMLGNMSNYFIGTEIVATGPRVRNLMSFDSRPAVVDEVQVDDADKGTINALRNLILAATGSEATIGVYASSFFWRTSFKRARTPVLIANPYPQEVLTAVFGRTLAAAIARRVVAIEFPPEPWKGGALVSNFRIDGCLVKLYQKYMLDFLRTHDFVDTMKVLAAALKKEYDLDFGDAIAVIEGGMDVLEVNVERAVLQKMLSYPGRYFYERISAALSDLQAKNCIHLASVKNEEEEVAISKRVYELYQTYPTVRTFLKYVGPVFGIEVVGADLSWGPEPKLAIYVATRCFGLKKDLSKYKRQYMRKLGNAYRITLDRFLEALISSEENT